MTQTSMMIYSTFEIAVPPSITVTSPNGGQTWYKNVQYDVTWTSVNVTGNVKITLRDASSEVLVINNSTANDGVDPWTVPDTLGDGDFYEE